MGAPWPDGVRWRRRSKGDELVRCDDFGGVILPTEILPLNAPLGEAIGEVRWIARRLGRNGEADVAGAHVSLSDQVDFQGRRRQHARHERFRLGPRGLLAMHGGARSLERETRRATPIRLRRGRGTGGRFRHTPGTKGKRCGEEDSGQNERLAVHVTPWCHVVVAAGAVVESGGAECAIAADQCPLHVRGAGCAGQQNAT